MQPTHNVQRLLDLYGTMCRIRAFETAALNAHKEGVVPGPLHVSIGQEGVATGVCLNLTAEDRITSNHRGHGHAIAKGAGVQGMMRELFGREGGHCRGKGGSMHIADFSVGMLGANGVVSGGIPIAVGAAQGLKMLKSSAIAVCFFGDGAINRGPFLEGLNWAALYNLPVLFICEDNGVSAFTQTDSVTAGPGVIARAESLGVPGVTVDGNDVMAVDEAAARLVAEVRGGKGPRLLHAKTYRITGHTSTDAATWRDPADVEAAKKRCPIDRLSALLGERGVQAADLAAIRTKAEAEMAEAVVDAKGAPWPQEAIAYEDVQDVGAVRFAGVSA
ncbi:MAG: thiamine pyrophosphate-dependent dehydrogenase E1 component subunit alpha [Phreatobacter sp.]|nr:thiamine pyrophosphate-dependent dehydrogenase E1 component subunit alpha [Phreatobacter sp.]